MLTYEVCVCVCGVLASLSTMLILVLLEQVRRIEVPADKVGALMGKGGDNIRAIRSESGVVNLLVQQDKDRSGPATVVLTGTQVCVRVCWYAWPHKQCLSTP